MRVLILAAGIGSRFNNQSKAFLEIQGQPIIERMISQLVGYGLGPIYVVVGHQADKFTGIENVQLLLNSNYHAGDNAQGLMFALDAIGFEDTLIIDADVVLTPGALQPLLDSYKAFGESVSLVDLTFDDEEAMKLVIENDRIVEYSKERGIGAEICTLVTAPVLREIYTDLPHLRWWGVGVGEGKLCPRVAPLPTGARWIEIDTPEEYEIAREMFDITAP